MKRSVSRAALALVTIGAIALAAQRIEWTEVVAVLGTADVRLLVVVTLLNVPIVLAKSERWRVLLSPFAVIGRGRLFHYLVVSYAASIALPARAGEVLRLYVLRRRHAVPLGASLGIAAVEKLGDAVGLLVISLPLVLAPKLPPLAVRALAILAVVLLAGIAIVLVVVALGRGRALMAPLAAGLDCIRSPRALVLATVLSVAAWAFDLWRIQLLLSALGLHLPWATPWLITLSLNLAIALPGLPANLGAFEAGATIALVALGVDPNRALAFALLHHTLQLVPTLLAGLTGLSLVRELVGSTTNTEAIDRHGASCVTAAS